MGKQVLKRRSSNGSAVGPPGQSIYTICSPLMLQHIKFSSVIASLNWLVPSRLQNWIDMFLWLFIRLLLELFRLLFELIRLLLELLRLLLELILLDLLWHQKILYLVAPFMGKQVLKRRSSNGSAVGPPGQSIYTICSPLMLQHIKFSSVIASLNWLVPSRLQNWIEMFLWLFIRLFLELIRLLLELLRLILLLDLL